MRRPRASRGSTMNAGDLATRAKSSATSPSANTSLASAAPPRTVVVSFARISMRRRCRRSISSSMPSSSSSSVTLNRIIIVVGRSENAAGATTPRRRSRARGGGGGANARGASRASDVAREDATMAREGEGARRGVTPGGCCGCLVWFFVPGRVL